ncbi:MAG TPA: serine hydrolase domain-containing protein [Gemmatimonadaceae bacterium]|nr:serine hydrolase domain-containing protein [Gemmatimonadaceae bacterium]
MLRRVVLATIVFAGSAGAQGAATDSAARWVDSIFAPYASRQSPGCAVGVTRDGALVFSRGYGMADLEHDTPITPATRFYIASLSKQFTAMSIVLLAQEHRLSLDDSIRRWVPEVPSFGTTITLRQLLHHTSGLRDYFTLLALSGWPSDGQLTEKGFLDLVARQKSLNFNPGDEFLYSNTGYALLSIVVHRASGQSLRDFARERIFDPLGMWHTEFRDDHTQLIPQRALGYQPSGATYRISQPEFDIVGDGGVYSTVEDLAKWDANFRTGRVGGKAALALLQQPGRLNDGQSIPYAFALTIGQYHGVRTISHHGAYGGYRSTLLRFPDNDLSVITLCNTSAAPSSLAEQVGSLLLGIIPKQQSATTLDLSTRSWSVGTSAFPADSTDTRRRSDQLGQLAGSYYSEELELPVNLTVRDGVLIMQRPRAGDLRFVTLSNDLFTNSDQMLLRVLRDDNGAVNGFTLTISRVRDLQFVRRTPAPTPNGR